MLVLNWNCANGIVHKMDEVRLIIEKYNPDLFFVCEAELKNDQLDLIQIQGYSLEISDSIKLGKSRLIAYCKTDTFNRITRLEGDSENVIVLETRTERFVGIYRGFKNYKQPGFDSLNYIFNLLNEASKTRKGLLLIGDFNIDPGRDISTPQGQLLESLLIDNGLAQLVNFPTRSRVVQRASGMHLEESMIDLVLPGGIDNLSVGSESTTSDHVLIVVDIKKLTIPSKTTKRTIRDWTQLTPRNVARLVSGAPDPRTFDELSESFDYLLNKLAPPRVIRTRLPENMINPKVEKIKKKRDRLYRMYKLSMDSHYLDRVKRENIKLKKMIRKETKRIFQKKAESVNTKSFWQTVNQLQGKVKKTSTNFIVNGTATNDGQLIADGFAEFFEDKILKLTSKMQPILPRLKEHVRPINFSLDELQDSLKYYRTKMSSGPDGVPMRLVKFYAQKRPTVVLNIFNQILDTEFPDAWRLARVTPVPKKGDLSILTNYRPVSNLPSLSKLFERCILHRLMQLPNFSSLIGDNQHGFRSGCSTTTCLLQLKDAVCDKLDLRENVMIYSLDLSAAFDMLRPDTFKELLHEKIPRDLLGILDEFLTNRRFYVKIDGKTSQIKAIDRGCPQGSVLGPVLFNLYTGAIINKLLKEVLLTSYADDSYVVVHDSNVESLIKRTEECLSVHVASLEEIGMKVNDEKTEILLFGKNSPNVAINVRGTSVQSKDSIKALGLHLDKGLTWKPHVASLKSKVMKTVGGVRMVRNKLSQKEATSVVTAQVFSVLYYACCVWLTPSINKKVLGTVEKLHYRALRLIVRDYRQKLSREVVTTKTNRLPPDKWSKFSLASLFLNGYSQRSPITQRMSENFYSKRRSQGFLYAFDSSRSKIGRQSTKNWIGRAIGQIISPWSNLTLSKDSIRVLLKKSFRI